MRSVSQYLEKELVSLLKSYMGEISGFVRN